MKRCPVMEGIIQVIAPTLDNKDLISIYMQRLAHFGEQMWGKKQLIAAPWWRRELNVQLNRTKDPSFIYKYLYAEISPLWTTILRQKLINCICGEEGMLNVHQKPLTRDNNLYAEISPLWTTIVKQKAVNDMQQLWGAGSILQLKRLVRQTSIWRLKLPLCLKLTLCHH